MSVELKKHLVNGGSVRGSSSEGYHLSLPALPAGTYGLAQLDNYMHQPRWKFPFQPPLRMRIEARVSTPDHPGTWGFGLWNDPFSFGFAGGGMQRVLPVLPNAAWFFYGSRHNHLSLRDDLPGSGFLAKTYTSPRLPGVFSLLGVPFLPLIPWKATARLIRKLARIFVKESAAEVTVPVEGWHAYDLLWMPEQVVFCVDGAEVLRTNRSPRGRLGGVIWMDNQYFRFDPHGTAKFGNLAVPKSGWLEVRKISWP